MIETAGLTKRYPGVTALSDVNLAAHAGEIHALVGANGAGKSTLMNVLSGVTRPTAGALRLDGREVSFETPGAAQAAGVATVFQELSLVPQLSVARNLFLGREEVGRFGLVDVAAMERDAAEILSRHALDIDPAATVASLSVARQQMLEIARALTQDARILILDEPTAVLSLTEQNALFEIMRRLSAEGLLILYVSHRLDEVLAIADRVSVMRDGQLVATRPAAGLEMDELVTLMIGRRGAASGRAAPSARPAPRYEIGYETARGREELSIGRGEILGLAGLVGAGRTTFARALAGVPTHGAKVTVRREGRPLRLGSPGRRCARGSSISPRIANATVSSPIWTSSRTPSRRRSTGSPVSGSATRGASARARPVSWNR